MAKSTIDDVVQKTVKKKFCKIKILLKKQKKKQQKTQKMK